MENADSLPSGSQIRSISRWFLRIGWGGTTTSFGESSPPDEVIGKRESYMTSTARKVTKPSRGRADLTRLRRVSDAEIARTAPAELADLPDNFWDEPTIVLPSAKKAISLRLDEDVLSWFKASGPRYQSRINAILRNYMTHMRRRLHRQ